MPKFKPRYDVNENWEKRTEGSPLNKLLNPASVPANRSSTNYEDVRLDRITPRSINRYTQSNIERLAKSIEKTGRLISPITLVRAKDLPEDSEVINAYRKKGIDPDSLDLIIVAGERRYRAFQLLKSREEERIKDILGATNRFEYINANILTPAEAKREETFYLDSNMEARILSLFEIVTYIDVAYDELKTEEGRRQAYEELIALHPECASQRFPYVDYIQYVVLERDFKVTDWSRPKITYYWSIVKNCTPEVKEAMYYEKITADDAFTIKGFEPEVQNNIIAILENEGEDAFNREISSIKNTQADKKAKNKRKKTSKYSSATANKQTKKILKDQKADLDLLKEMVSSLGGESRAEYDKIVKAFDKCKKEVERILEGLG